MSISIARASLALGALAASLAVAPGCATVKPSSQLDAARAMYKQAARDASKLAPARLLTAEKKLRQAEKANKDEPAGAKEKHLAYIATRLSELAIAHAKLRAARKRQSAAVSSYMDAQDNARRRSQRALAATRDALANLERKLKAAKGESSSLKKLRAKLLAKKAELQKSLDAERAARLAAEKKAAAAMSKLTQIAKIRQAQEETIITLSGGVLFSSGKSALLPLARQKLAQVVTALKAQLKSRKILIKGHTDSRGSATRNQELSLARANAVRIYLIEQGLKAARITAVGKGESEPVATNSTATGRASNRRVEIILRKAQ